MVDKEFAQFVEIARFNSRLEAETVGHALDQFEIPFFVQSQDIGIFGPGHMGSTPAGAGLCVPEDRVEEATELLHCAVFGEYEDVDDTEDTDATDGPDSTDDSEDS